jgi:hypothetical protein
MLNLPCTGFSQLGGYRPENVTTGITGANLAPPYPRNSQQARLMMVIDAWKKAAGRHSWSFPPVIAAFDGAWQCITASGARLSGQQRELTRELLAKYIIQQARQGELDQCRLRDGALLHLAQSNLRHPPTSSRP